MGICFGFGLTELGGFFAQPGWYRLVNLEARKMGIGSLRGAGIALVILLLGSVSAQGNWERIPAQDLLTGEDQTRVSLRETPQAQFQFRDGILSFECRRESVVVSLEHDFVAFSGNYTLHYRVGDSGVKPTIWAAQSGGETRGGLLFMAAVHIVEFVEDLMTYGEELVIRFDDQTYLFHHAGVGDAVSSLPCVTFD